MNRKIHILLLLTAIWCGSCNDDENDLPSASDRSEEAIDELLDELTDPANGWLLNYQPNPNTGQYLILLNFNKNGEVNIKSDVPDEDGFYFDQTVPYSVTSSLGIKLTIDTYSVFHRMFEYDRSTFGAEFNFLFDDEKSGRLLFTSGTDLVAPTELELIPVASSIDLSASQGLSENLQKYEGFTPIIFGGEAPTQQLILEDKNISILMSNSIRNRIIQFDIAGVGTTLEEIEENNVPINRTIPYTLSEGKIVLNNSVSVSIGGETITLSEIELTELTLDGDVVCSTSTENTPIYKGQATGLGAVTLLRSTFDSGGVDFQPQEDEPYAVNVLFIFDNVGRSLFERGSIAEKFPNALGFVFNYGLDSVGVPAYATGFILEKPNGERKTYLREFEPTTTDGNKITITLKDDYFYSETPDSEEEMALEEITNEIFGGGGEFIIYDLDNNPGVFRLYNPCSGYEFFLV